MKYLSKLAALLLCLSSFNAWADVNSFHAMNVFKGKYEFTDDYTGVKVKFEVNNKGKISLEKNDAYEFAKTTVNALGNEIGPDGLSVLTVLLAGGSDEQTTSLHIRLVPIQGERGTSVELLSFDYLENDGPNAWTVAEKKPGVALYKFDNKSKRYLEVKRVR